MELLEIIPSRNNVVKVISFLKNWKFPLNYDYVRHDVSEISLINFNHVNGVPYVHIYVKNSSCKRSLMQEHSLI